MMEVKIKIYLKITTVIINDNGSELVVVFDGKTNNFPWIKHDLKNTSLDQVKSLFKKITHLDDTGWINFKISELNDEISKNLVCINVCYDCFCPNVNLNPNYYYKPIKELYV